MISGINKLNVPAKHFQADYAFGCGEVNTKGVNVRNIGEMGSESFWNDRPKMMTTSFSKADFVGMAQMQPFLSLNYSLWSWLFISAVI